MALGLLICELKLLLEFGNRKVRLENVAGYIGSPKMFSASF
jgi:hypothetical protein